MAAAIVPLPPLRSADLRLRQLATGAGLAAALQAFLFTSGECFRLRLGVLRFRFRLVQRSMRRSTERLKRSPGAPPSPADFASAKDDSRKLDLDHTRSFQALMASLAAKGRALLPCGARLLPLRVGASSPKALPRPRSTRREGTWPFFRRPEAGAAVRTGPARALP
jgi:hypothetical protein